MKRLDGKTILIAGSGGIGAGLAERYAAEGANVVLGDIDIDGVESVAAAISAAGGSIVATRLDGADEASVGDAVALAVSTFGGLDGLHVNFAKVGGDPTHGLLDMTMDEIDDSLRVNLRGYVLCTRAALPPMIERGGGSIVYTSSGSAYVAEPVRVAYAMAKSGGHALMRHVASRYGIDGIRANSIAPGVIVHDRFPAEVRAAMEGPTIESTFVKSRVGRPEDIAAAGAYLLSDDAGYVTGQVISVDGGRTVRA
ncbi:SDR family NAD(P)-dependent oxidoreductase [Leifsonia sp. A12D58]|uniref:SDR family NAD(P)-dependent oxidoreductase n=1 Tax=Leifsonia sp. A12D58 TaxID=3397674 RepID=UPI0039E14A47